MIDILLIPLLDLDLDMIMALTSAPISTWSYIVARKIIDSFTTRLSSL